MSCGRYDQLLHFIQEKKQREGEAKSSEDATDAKEGEKDAVIALRPLNMEDMKYAKSQVGLIEKFSLKWL